MLYDCIQPKIDIVELWFCKEGIRVHSGQLFLYMIHSLVRNLNYASPLKSMNNDCMCVSETDIDWGLIYHM